LFPVALYHQQNASCQIYDRKCDQNINVELILNPLVLI